MNFILFQIRKRAKLIRYLISGGTSAATDLIILHVLTDYFHIWYIISAIIAFLIAFWVSFVMQKYWTFQDMSRDMIHKQLGMHITLGVVNLFLNTGLMYVFVDHLHIPYILAQILISGGLACVSFFIYKLYIFTGGQK